ncbi:MAG: MFS transporter [Bullifex sp.]
MDRKRSRNLLCIAMVFFWASEYCHAPYFTPYLESLGFASTLIGVMTGVYGFTQIFARIPLGIITDAFSCYKKTILFGTVATTLSSFFLMFATSFRAIMTCRVIAGLAASTWLAFTVLYNAYYKDDESVTAMTNVNAFSNGGKLLAFFLGIMTATVWGYKVPLLCSFLTGCVSIMAVIMLEPVKIKHESFSFSHVISVIKTPSIVVASLLAVMMQFYMQGTVFSFTSGRASASGASSFMIGVISLSFTLIQVLSAPFIGKKLLKKMSTGSALALGFLLLAASALMIAVTPEAAVMILANVLAGIGNLIINGLLMASVVSSVSEEKRSTAMGFYQAVYGIGMSLGPVAVGKMVSFMGYGGAYLSVASLMMITAIAACLLIKRFR